MRRFTQWAGEHGFEHRIESANAAGLQFVTALPKKNNVVNVASDNRAVHAVATWGHQVVSSGLKAVHDDLPNENPGLAVIVPAKAALDIPDDDANLFVGLRLENNSAHWYVGALYDQEGSESLVTTTSDTTKWLLGGTLAITGRARRLPRLVEQ